MSRATARRSSSTRRTFIVLNGRWDGVSKDLMVTSSSWRFIVDGSAILFGRGGAHFSRMVRRCMIAAGQASIPKAQVAYSCTGARDSAYACPHQTSL